MRDFAKFLNKNSTVELIKLADFLQAENTEIFNKKFEGKDPDYVKELADRFYFIFKPMKDYNEYRSLANSISTIEELEEFLAKCDNAVSIISKKISSFGIRESGAIDMAKQFVQKYYKDLDFIIPKVNESNTKEDMFSLLRGEKKKVKNEFEGKDISGLSTVYTDWILKIFELSKSGGEAHSIDDIISLAKTFKSSEQKLEKKISEFNSYSEASRYLNDNSGVSKKVYTESIRVAAQENDMSRIVYNDDRWTVVLIGSTIGGQWWGRDTDFCISGIENNLYSSYATEDKIDPYFIIDKLAESSDPMRKFTIAIQYDESGKFKISDDSFTMTDARNIGISLNSIQAALGKDYNKIFDSINRDAATREENIGTINNNKIAAKISEKDYEFIRKYEKEIIANENLTESTLKVIKNTGDAEKVKNIIKSCTDNFPSNFLKNFIDKPWAKDYIPAAVESLAEKDPSEFLKDFIDKPWAKKHIPTAAKSCAEKDPYFLLSNFIDKPWAKKHIPTAAETWANENPLNFLTDFIDKPWAELYIPTAAESLAKNNPYIFLAKFVDKSWAEEHIPTAAGNWAKENPSNFLLNFGDKPWAEPYLSTVVESSAESLAEKAPHNFLSKFIDKSWAKDYIPAAVESLVKKDPVLFLKDFGDRALAKPYIDSIANNLVENNPIIFLYNLTNRDWAKDYIPAAAKNYAEKYPSEFLKNFIDKPWAELYIPTAAESLAESDPSNFIVRFEDKPWAQTYLASIAKSWAKKYPSHFLDKLINKPWAQPYITTAAENYAKSDTRNFLRYSTKYDWAKKHIPTAVKSCVEKSPRYFLENFIDKPWAELYIPAAAKSCAEKEPHAFLENFIDKPWAKLYIPIAAKSCAEKDPVRFLKDFIDKPWAQKHIPTAAKSCAEKDPVRFLNNFIDKPWANEPREGLDGKSCVQYVKEMMQKEVLEKESSHSPKLTTLAKVLRSIGLSKEASEVLKIR